MRFSNDRDYLKLCLVFVFSWLLISRCKSQEFIEDPFGTPIGYIQEKKGISKFAILFPYVSRFSKLETPSFFDAIVQRETLVSELGLAVFKRVTSRQNEIGATAIFLREIEKDDSINRIGVAYTNFTDSDLVLIPNQNTEILDLGGSLITKKCIDSIESMRGLRSLGVYDTDVEDSFLVKLSSLKSLRTISVSGCFFTRRVFSSFVSNSNLVRIAANGLRYDEFGRSDSSQKFRLESKTLRWLDLSHSDVRNFVFGDCPNLEVIYLIGSEPSPEQLTSLCKLPSIKQVYVDLSESPVDLGITYPQLVFISKAERSIPRFFLMIPSWIFPVAQHTNESKGNEENNQCKANVMFTE